MHGIDKGFRPIRHLRGDANFPVLGPTRYSLRERLLPLIADLLGLLERRQLDEPELDDLFGRRQVRAGIPFDSQPRREQDVGDFAEWSPWPSANVGTQTRRNLQSFSSQHPPGPILVLAAVDLVTDPDCRVDIAAAPL